MTSADTSHTTNSRSPDDEALLRDANILIDQDREQNELANFAALADPDTIAGTSVAIDHNARTRIERENSDLVGRLRAELQRRAKQVENLSRDLSSNQTAKTETEERLRDLSDEVAQVRTSIGERERSHKETTQPKSLGAPDKRSGAQTNKPAPFASARPVEHEAGTLRRLLHAAHNTRRALEEQLTERDSELEKTRAKQTKLRDTVQALRQECESQAEARAQTQGQKTKLENQSAEIRSLNEECDNLRRSLVQAQRVAAEAEKSSQRTKDAMGDTRNRVTTREAEANALRSALATNQMQAQARECENEELRAALSIASQTLESRRAELKSCKLELTAATEKLQRVELQNSALDNELAAQNQLSNQQSSELSQMNLTLPRLEQNLSDRSSEIELMRARLEERNNEVAELRESLTQTQMRRDCLADDLATEQQALARARSRGAEREATLANLRETLASIGKAATVLPTGDLANAKSLPANRQPKSRIAEIAQPEFDGSPPGVAGAATDLSGFSDLVSAEDGQSTRESDEIEREVSSGIIDIKDIQDVNNIKDIDKTADSMRTEHPSTEFEPTNGPESRQVDVTDKRGHGLLSLIPIRTIAEPVEMFHSWRDKQIAKKLAPLGISGIDDFFIYIVSPLLEAESDKLVHVLSLGGTDPEFELQIARGLRRQGHERFRIHFPEVDSAHGREILSKASQLGLDQELVSLSQDKAPALGAGEFQAIISDGALSSSKSLDALMEALVASANDGVRIAVSERVGTANSRTAREMGDRIWQLMPERYKLNRLTQENESNYWTQEAGLAGDSDLLSNLRAHFVFEDFASFGHLVDRFVSPEIGPNFDPNDERDRRFIEQISNLDEAKLDSGALDPLHMVARLTAR